RQLVALPVKHPRRFQHVTLARLFLLRRCSRAHRRRARQNRQRHTQPHCSLHLLGPPHSILRFQNFCPHKISCPLPIVEFLCFTSFAFNGCLFWQSSLGLRPTFSLPSPSLSKQFTLFFLSFVILFKQLKRGFRFLSRQNPRSPRASRPQTSQL